MKSLGREALFQASWVDASSSTLIEPCLFGLNHNQNPIHEFLVLRSSAMMLMERKTVSSVLERCFWHEN